MLSSLSSVVTRITWTHSIYSETQGREKLQKPVTNYPNLLCRRMFADYHFARAKHHLLLAWQKSRQCETITALALQSPWSTPRLPPYGGRWKELLLDSMTCGLRFRCRIYHKCVGLADGWDDREEVSLMAKVDQVIAANVMSHDLGESLLSEARSSHN